MASSVIHIVRLPRLTSEASYSGQFVTRYLALGILWRRASLNLYGMDLTRMNGLRRYRQSVNLAIGSNYNLRHQQHNLWSIRAPTRHGTRRRRAWRKLHLGVDAGTSQI